MLVWANPTEAKKIPALSSDPSAVPIFSVTCLRTETNNTIAFADTPRLGVAQLEGRFAGVFSALVRMAIGGVLTALPDARGLNHGPHRHKNEDRSPP